MRTRSSPRRVQRVGRVLELLTQGALRLVPTKPASAFACEPILPAPSPPPPPRASDAAEEEAVAQPLGSEDPYRRFYRGELTPGQVAYVHNHVRSKVAATGHTPTQRPAGPVHPALRLIPHSSKSSSSRVRAAWRQEVLVPRWQMLCAAAPESGARGKQHSYLPQPQLHVGMGGMGAAAALAALASLLVVLTWEAAMSPLRRPHQSTARSTFTCKGCTQRTGVRGIVLHPRRCSGGRRQHDFRPC